MAKKVHYINTLTYQLEVTTSMCYELMQNWFSTKVKNKITFDEYVVLDTLVYYPHLDKNLLALTLIKNVNYVEKVLTKLEKKNLIKKVNTPNTKIKVRTYEITNTGDKVYNEVSELKDETVKLLAKFISENELVTFTKTLLKIKTILISLENSEALQQFL